ncbi:MAG: hypothetical protein IJU44_05165 [Kiritimatiellae bacterium]|nr:hypothetical protein [Kiritimatiellia bacterium]
MKPLEILTAFPKWAKATPDQIIDSPAFAMPCRLGEETETLRFDAVQGGDTLDLTILFGDEPHLLRLSRSPHFPELSKLWDNRAAVPEPILLALVERECGPLFQLLENAVRRQVRLAGLAGTASLTEVRTVFAQVADIPFALTRSATVVNALGIIRHLDVTHPSLRAETLTAETEYAAFALQPTDLAALTVGDALLLPEIGTVPPRLIVDGRLVADEAGVAPFAEDGRCRIVGAEPSSVTMGELLDAAEKPHRTDGAPPNQLRLLQNGKTIARGRLDRLGEQPAFIVESPTT